jgi:hypothetical protein
MVTRTKGSDAMSEPIPISTAIKQTLTEVEDGLKQVLAAVGDGEAAHRWHDELISKVIEGYSIVQQSTELLLQEGRRWEGHIQSLTQVVVASQGTAHRPPEAWGPTVRRWAISASVCLSLAVAGCWLFWLPKYRTFTLEMHRVVQMEWSALNGSTQVRILGVYRQLGMVDPRPGKGGK